MSNISQLKQQIWKIILLKQSWHTNQVWKSWPYLEYIRDTLEQQNNKPPKKMQCITDYSEQIRGKLWSFIAYITQQILTEATGEDVATFISVSDDDDGNQWCVDEALLPLKASLPESCKQTTTPALQLLFLHQVTTQSNIDQSLAEQQVTLHFILLF